MSRIANLFQQFAKMQWSDYLDVFVVALIIFSILPLIKTHNTMRIAKVVVAVVIAAWLTEILNLHTLNWIMDQVLNVGLMAVVVIFQPELRRMMDRLGSVEIKKILGMTKPRQELDNMVTQIVMACEVMSRERVGALIVFARDSRLDDFCKTGTAIDGMVSEQMIRNIFFPKAALHDGAMIIRDGRIAAAGCVLPLSDSQRLSADLGTRHRAGVGMSEATDAVIVIVSEETGTISVAVGGMLKRHLAARTLEQLLKKELATEESQNEKKSLQAMIDRILDGTKEGTKHEK